MSFFTKLNADSKAKADAITAKAKVVGRKVAKTNTAKVLGRISYKTLTSALGATIAVSRPAVNVAAKGWAKLEELAKEEVVVATK